MIGSSFIKLRATLCKLRPQILELGKYVLLPVTLIRIQCEPTTCIKIKNKIIYSFKMAELNKI